MVRISKSTSFLLTLLIPALGCPRSNSCCLVAWHEEKWCGDCVTDRMSAGQRRNVSFWHGAFLTNQLRPCSQALPAWLWIFGNMWLKRDKKALSSGHFGLIGAASRVSVCVCSGGMLSNLSAINEAVFWNSDVTYLSCCLLPPPPRYSLFPVTRRVTRKTVYSNY